MLTSLYPSAIRPYEGIFAERRWTRMRARGHEVSVTHPLPRAPLAFGRREWAEIRQMPAEEERGGIVIRRPRYLHVPRRTRANARAFANTGLRRILRTGRPDVVVADYAWPASAAAAPCARRGLPLVVSGRGSDVLQVAGEAGLGADLGANLRAAGHWCAVSRDLLGVMDRLGERPDHGVLVPNGVDLDLFRPRDRGEARAALGLDATPWICLVVGHLIERKDPLLALRTWHAWTQAARASSSLVFVGDGPLAGALDREIATLGVGEQVRRITRLPPEELAQWYAAADALLLTSWREGRPNVVLEALACGLPILATEAGGTSELLEGLDGMLARTRDPRQLAKMLDATLSHPLETAGRGVLRDHARRFTWDNGLEALEACLEAAIAEGPGAGGTGGTGEAREARK